MNLFAKLLLTGFAAGATIGCAPAQTAQNAARGYAAVGSGTAQRLLTATDAAGATDTQGGVSFGIGMNIPETLAIISTAEPFAAVEKRCDRSGLSATSNTVGVRYRLRRGWRIGASFRWLNIPGVIRGRETVFSLEKQTQR